MAIELYSKILQSYLFQFQPKQGNKAPKAQQLTEHERI